MKRTSQSTAVRLLGHLHQTLAQRADHVVEIVASIPLPVKGGLPL